MAYVIGVDVQSLSVFTTITRLLAMLTNQVLFLPESVRLPVCLSIQLSVCRRKNQKNY